jgi:ATP-dependent protease ClpP protease subunit
MAKKKVNETEYEYESESGDEVVKEPAVICFETPLAGKALHFYLSESVGAAKDYIEMIQRIKCAGPHDVVYIYLNTPGGYINTGIQIISAMKISQAHIITVLEGEVSSLGTLIFLHGDEMVVHDHCLFMIHNHSGGLFGKGHEYLAQANATSKWFEEFARDTYLGFLTEDEIGRMLAGEDFWMGSIEVRERLQDFVAHLEEKQKLKELEAKKAEEDAAKPQPKPRKKRVAKKKI